MTHQKGEVGQITTAINVVVALNQRGRHVLFVDLDPRDAVTEGPGFFDAYDTAPPSLSDVLTAPRERD